MSARALLEATRKVNQVNASPSLPARMREVEEAPAPLAAEAGFGHDFSRVQLDSDGASGKQECPLPLASPRHCPFGGACHTCPPRVQGKRGEGLTGARSEPAAVPAIVHEVLRSPGQPLDAQTRSQMEPSFGHSFGDVRVHADARAVESARVAHARAYTVGRNIIFGAAEYTPRTPEGRRLLAHELVHVVQQDSAEKWGESDDLDLGPASFETEADHIADRVLQGLPAGAVSALPVGALQRAGPQTLYPRLLTDEQLVEEYWRVLGESDPETEEYFEAVQAEMDARFLVLAGQGTPTRPAEIETVPIETADQPVTLAFVAPAGPAAELAAQRMAQLALEEAAVAARVAPAAAAGAEAATGVTAVGEAATGAATAAETSLLASIAFWGLVLLLPFTLASDTPVPRVEPQPEPRPVPEPPAQPEPPRRRPRRCESGPCPEPLPIRWPAELPLPDDADDLARTPADVREAEGLGDRGRAQARLHEEIVRTRQQGMPPPSPCDPDVEWDPYRWNAPFDAHHKHPLYLGGVDAAANLCALEADLHQSGHPRLDDQTEFLPVYEQCGICSGRLSAHPEYQYYVIVGTK